MTCGRPVSAPPRHVFRADRTPASPRRASAPFAAACRRVLASEAWEVLERRRAAVVRVGEVPRSIRFACVTVRRLHPVVRRVFLHSFFLMFSIHFSLRSTARYEVQRGTHSRRTLFASTEGLAEDCDSTICAFRGVVERRPPVRSWEVAPRIDVEREREREIALLS